MTPRATALFELIQKRRALIGILGLGYVGLPLALTFSEKGFSVLGFDVDSRKAEVLNRGESYIEHFGGDRVAGAVRSGRLEASTDFGRLKEPDVLVICVPTPLTLNRDPDMTFVVKTAEEISQHLRPGQMVILESTTYPGTTDDLVCGILERSGLSNGNEFFLAYSPEREDPGNPRYGTDSIPKVVGGTNDDSADLACALYDAIVVSTVRVSSARTAEATKLTENIFRAVNIALVNELKLIYDRMGIDVWEVLDAASTKPFGFMRFQPGPGWGGHCIPIDPFYLSWKSRQHGYIPRFIELAGEVNTQMPAYVVEKLRLALSSRGTDLSDSRILVVGIAYKKDIADPRESPAFEVLSHLLEAGADVAYHDPHIPVAPAMRSWEHLPPLHSQPLSREVLSSMTAVILVTDHSNIDYPALLDNSALIVDTRGVFRHPHPKVVRA